MSNTVEENYLEEDYLKELQNLPEDVEEENNLFKLPVIVNKLKRVLFRDEEKKIYGIIKKPEHQLQLMDLILQSYNDYILADIIKQITEGDLPQAGFQRKFAEGVIERFPERTKLYLAQKIILELLEEYGRKILFLMDGDEIISVFAFRENETGFSLKIELALRGTLTQRQRAILYWNKNKNAIFKQFYDLGYKRVYMQAIAERNRLIKVIMRGESPEAFQSNKMLETGKFNNKIMPYREYMLNLGVKYKNV